MELKELTSKTIELLNMDRTSEIGLLGMERLTLRRQPNRRLQWLSVMEHIKH